MVRPGQLVTSTAGRDRGKQYLVVGTSPDGTALVADGQGRGIDRPKRKNPKHLVVHQQVAGEIAAKLAEASTVSDEEIRDALMSLTQRHRGGL
ncbi:MAG: RNA-binding protein [Limnochordia bacterium]|jgi:large subunit ribosomal protein L14e|nr:RNA-binding protein [Bacillota bacterium]